jgi:diguanylate cyclase
VAGAADTPVEVAELREAGGERDAGCRQAPRRPIAGDRGPVVPGARVPVAPPAPPGRGVATLVARLGADTASGTSIVSVSPEFRAVTGHGAEIVGRDPFAVLRRADAVVAAAVLGRLGAGAAVEEIVHVARADGTEAALRASTIPVDLSGTGPFTHLVTTLSAPVAAAHLDPLTGLPSRGALFERLRTAMAARSADGAVAVLFVDVDHFKLVNDSLGHAAGDRVLVEFADRLRRCSRPGDSVTRFGGDEFVVAMDRTGAGEAARVAQRIIDAMAAPITLGDRELVLSASVGVAVSGPDADSPEQLLRNADTALYEAKARGRARTQPFNAELRRTIVRRLELESDLRSAIRNGRLELHYQPQVDLVTGEVVGLEALARWRHPVHGPIAPEEFVPLAEDAGLIGALGGWVFNEACAQFASWRRSSPRVPRSLTVNVSVLQLDDPAFIDGVQTTVSRREIDPSALCLELTESALMRTSSRVLESLARLRALGVYVGVDDFGTGYSSLGRLRDLPVEVIKIDRSFVDGLGTEGSDSSIVASIMSLAFAMGLHAVAEGVERPCQAVHLAALGCSVAQGYLFAPPLPPGEAAALFGKRLWRPPPIERTGREIVAPNVARRRGTKRFIDEFLDHIGVPMSEWDDDR